MHEALCKRKHNPVAGPHRDFFLRF